jgi:hypothetical protein
MMRLSPGLVGQRELWVAVTAIAAVVAGVSAAVAILTDSSAPVAIAIVGLAVMVVSRRRPSPWLARANDLTTLSLSADDLDACLTKARRAETRRGERDREAVLDSVTLVLPGRQWKGPDVPTVRFRVREHDGRGWQVLAFDRPPPRTSSGAPGARADQGIDPVTAPQWRLDDSWPQLVALSWLRMQPFVGTVVLEPLSVSRRRRRLWEISYRAAEPKDRGETTSFRLRATGIYRPARTRRARGGVPAVG